MKRITWKMQRTLLLSCMLHKLTFLCSITNFIYHFHVLYTHNPCIQVHKVRTSLVINCTRDGQVKIQGLKKPYICNFQHMKTWHCCLNNYARIPTLKPHVINAQVLTHSLSFLDHLIHIHQLLFTITSYLWISKLLDIPQALWFRSM